jgi:branched-chain amino acid transport system permease protein
MTFWNRSGNGGLVGQRERTALFSGRRLLHWLGLAMLVLYVAALLTAPWYMNRGQLSLAYLVLYFVLLAASWNIVSGFTGYINFAHAAFIGMGMYGAAIAIVDYQLHWLLAVGLGGLIAAAYAAVLSFPLLRVKGPYFAITTLAIAEGTRVLMSTGYMEPLTRAGSGIPLFVRVSMETKYFAMLALVVAVVLVTYLIANSRIGLRLLAIREDEHAAESLGIDTTLLKIGVFVLSALFAGLGGGLHATFLSYIDPFNAFHIQFTVIPIVMAFFGGIGTVLGPVIGGTVLQLLNDYVWTNVLRLNMAAFGVVLVVLILFLPQGILEWLKERDYLPKTRKI